MSLVSLIVICLSAFILLKGFILPLMRRHWRAVTMHAKAGRAGGLVLAETAAELALVGFVSLSLVVLIVAVSGWLAASDVTLPKTVIAWMASAHEIAKTAADYDWVLAVVGLIGAALALWGMADVATKRVKARWHAQADKILESLANNEVLQRIALQNPEFVQILGRFRVAAKALADAKDRNESKEKIAKAKEALDKIYTELGLEMARDGFDPLDAANETSNSDDDREKTRLGGLLSLLTSRQLGRDLFLVRRSLSVAVTFLLLLSLVGWTASPMADNLRLAVNNLVVNFDASEVRRDLSELLSRSDPTDGDSHEVKRPADDIPPSERPEDTRDGAADEEDGGDPDGGGPDGGGPDRGGPDPRSPEGLQRAGELVARGVLRELPRSLLLEHSAGLRRTEEGDRAAEASARSSAASEFVRAAILGQRMQAPQSRSADPVPNLRYVVSLQVVERLERPATETPTAAFTELQRAAVEALEPLQTRSPNRFASILQRLEARYSQPIAPIDAQSAVIASMIETAFGRAVLSSGPDNEIHRQGEKLLAAAGEAAIRTWAQTGVANLVKQLLTESARPEVARDVRLRLTDEAERFAEALLRAERTGWTPEESAAAEARRALAVAQAATRSISETPAGVVAADRLAGYDRSFFPDLGAPPAPPPGFIPPLLPGGGGGGRVEADHRPVRPRTASKATDFRAMSRSSLVRGVLIGQDPRSVLGSPLDIIDIQWQERPPERQGAPTLLQLELRLADAPDEQPVWYSAGTYPAAVVNQALRYAADGRVVANTILPGGDTAVDRLTYLHPVLIDTPLGCRIIELDRLIDTFTYSKFDSDDISANPAIENMASDRKSMNRWVSVARSTEDFLLTQSPMPAPMAQPRRPSRNCSPGWHFRLDLRGLA